jgi:hypothetical protein
MHPKLSTFLTLYFALFGGVILVKYITWTYAFDRAPDIDGTLPEWAVIAFFVAVLLMLLNKVRVEWHVGKQQAENKYPADR